MKYVNETLGLEAARSGQDINSCPFENAEQKKEWLIGFRFHKPDDETTLEGVLAPYYGGPAYLIRSRSGNNPSYKSYETPFGDWCKPENYENTDITFFTYGEKMGFNKVFQEHTVQDGVYDVTGLPLCHIKNKKFYSEFLTPVGEEGLKFIMKYHPDNIYIVFSYQTNSVLLFAGQPKSFDNFWGNIGFASTALLNDCPKNLLIVAEEEED